LIVCKVRNGPIGDVLLHFDKGTTTFKNSTSHQIAPMSTQRFDSAADF
jgi:hypothetical protein